MCKPNGWCNDGFLKEQEEKEQEQEQEQEEKKEQCTYKECIYKI